MCTYCDALSSVTFLANYSDAHHKYKYKYKYITAFAHGALGAFSFFISFISFCSAVCLY